MSGVSRDPYVFEGASAMNDIQEMQAYWSTHPVQEYKFVAVTDLECLEGMLQGTQKELSRMAIEELMQYLTKELGKC